MKYRLKFIILLILFISILVMAGYYNTLSMPIMYQNQLILDKLNGENTLGLP